MINIATAQFVATILVSEFLVTAFGWSAIGKSQHRSSFIPRRTPLRASSDQSGMGAVQNDIMLDYGLASVSLSDKWLDLVRQEKVRATVVVQGSSPEEASVNVSYGVRMVQKEDNGNGIYMEEFVEQMVGNGTNPFIEQVNKTLASLQADCSPEAGASAAVKYSKDGNFVAQLQLVRTLRPPPSPGFGVKSSSIPPAYDLSQDSFVTGPLRLELRPLTAILNTPKLHTPWDVYHNVSPADSRGHFLLVPTLSDKANNRGQILTRNDCHDLVHLTATIHPAGSLLICYNSVGAGASQNHIHCHAWPSPPLPLLSEGAGWECYAVSKVKNVQDFVDLQGGDVEVSFLDYPCCCVELSSTDDYSLELLGRALSVILEEVGDAPHNVGMLNRPSATDETRNDVDVYVFVRQQERANVLPTLKLGVSEMMGVFHAQSDEELDTLVPPHSYADKDEGPMPSALRDVSYEPRWDLWEAIKERLTVEFEGSPTLD